MQRVSRRASMIGRIFISAIHQSCSPSSSFVCNRLLLPAAFIRCRLLPRPLDVNIDIRQNITTYHTDDIIKRLQTLCSGPLCDADKVHRSMASTVDDANNIETYTGIGLMCPNTMKLRSTINNNKMVD